MSASCVVLENVHCSTAFVGVAELHSSTRHSLLWGLRCWQLKLWVNGWPRHAEGTQAAARQTGRGAHIAV